MSEIYEELGNLQLAIKYAVKDVKEIISCGMEDDFTILYYRYHSIFELCIKGGYESKAEEIFHLFFNGAKELSEKDCGEYILEDGSIYKESENFAQYCVWMIEPYIKKNDYQIILRHKDVLSKFRNDILKVLKKGIIDNERLHLSNDTYFKMLEFLNGIRVNGEN